MKDYVYNILTRSPIFLNVDINQIKNILNNHKISFCKYDSGSVIKYINNTNDSLLILINGVITAEMIDNKGKNYIVEEIHPAKPIAIATIFSKTPIFPVNVVAKKECELISIPKNSLLKIMSENQQIMLNILKLISNKAQFLTKKLHENVMLNSDQKIAKFLLSYNSNNFVIKKTQETIARELGITRQSYVRSINKLIKQQILKKDNDKYTIIDINKLKKIL